MMASWQVSGWSGIIFLGDATKHQETQRRISKCKCMLPQQDQNLTDSCFRLAQSILSAQSGLSPYPRRDPEAEGVGDVSGQWRSSVEMEDVTGAAVCLTGITVPSQISTAVPDQQTRYRSVKMLRWKALLNERNVTALWNCCAVVGCVLHVPGRTFEWDLRLAAENQTHTVAATPPKHAGLLLQVETSVVQLVLATSGRF